MSSFVGPLTVSLEAGEFKQVVVPENLAPGAEASLRAKASTRVQDGLTARVLQELEEGVYEIGDCRKGEIELEPEAGMMTISGRFFSIVTWPVKFPPKTAEAEPPRGRFSSVEWNVGPDTGAATLPVDEDGNIVLIKSFRHAGRDREVIPGWGRGWRLEIPRGVRKPDESLDDCARREATEEAGLYELTTLQRLGDLEADTGILRNCSALYFARGRFDESRIRKDVSESELKLHRVSLAEFRKMMLDGRIIDGYTRNAYLLARELELI